MKFRREDTNFKILNIKRLTICEFDWISLKKAEKILSSLCMRSTPTPSTKHRKKEERKTFAPELGLEIHANKGSPPSGLPFHPRPSFLTLPNLRGLYGELYVSTLPSCVKPGAVFNFQTRHGSADARGGVHLSTIGRLIYFLTSIIEVLVSCHKRQAAGEPD